MAKYKGKFIVLDGPDRCGKGTQLRLAADYLFNANKSMHVLMTREPTGISEHGKEMRRLLGSKQDPMKIADRCLNLYVDDRWHHVTELVEPVIKYGGIAVSDRYKYSTAAYQLVQGVPQKRIVEAHKGLLKPDLVLIMLITAEAAMKRAGRMGDGKEIFERLKFQEKVIENYRRMKEIFPDENIVFIDGMRSVQEVFGDVKAELDKLLGLAVPGSGKADTSALAPAK